MKKSTRLSSRQVGERFTIRLVISAVYLGVAACGNSAPTTPTPPPTPEVAVFLALPAPVLGLVVDEENEVVAVEPGSAAAQSGRQVGDRLDKLDGLAFQEKAAIKRKVSAQAGGNALRLTITRRDQAITLDILPAPPAPRPNAPTATPVLTPLEYY